jgi:hypothetical protein
MLGTMILINLNCTQMLTGLSTPILLYSTSIKYVNNNWFKQIREFLLFVDASIKIKGCSTPTTKRKHDYNLMDKVNRLSLTVKEKQILNNWNIYFQVDTAADIVHPNGNKIIECFLNKVLVKQYTSTSKTAWPRQQMPIIQTFTIWSSILQTITKSWQSYVII